MFKFLFISLLILLVVSGYIYVKGRKRRERISELLSGSTILAGWDYAPNEWRKAVEEEFTWVRHKDGVGHVYISPTTIYIKNDSDDRLIDLSGDGKAVTHASYSGADMSPLKLRIRWKVEHYGDNSTPKVRYYKEDYRIPVPLAHREAAQRVVAFFTAQLENNPEVYANLVSDDEPLSIFCKDSF